MHQTEPFRLGIENLLVPEVLETLRGARVGLLTHPAGTDAQLRSTVDLLVAAQRRGGFTMTALLGPEHGVRGAAPAGAAVGDAVDARTGLPVRSLYGATQKPTPAMLADLDVLVIDLQDIGTRFFTYIWTLYLVLEAAAEVDLRVVVLDRPNPLGRGAEGFLLERELASFVGLRPIPQTHGLTIGELAALFREELLGGAVDLEVIAMSGYDPEDPWPADLPWVPPSPNIPTRGTAVLYAGTGLLEAVTVSEGRGTALPFRWFGAPFLTEAHLDEICERLRAAQLPGVLVRPMWATPTAGDHRDALCGGVQLHLTDVPAVEGVRTGLHVLAALRDASPEVRWRESDGRWIDALSGTRCTRQMLEDGAGAEEIVAAWRPEAERFAATARQHHRY
ncbi:exo-beta-N-acetylmuramidase NamZ domain-containing protein [Brachybacterium sp. YJGR34]|uniref:exo-beta-N-acetylmuramidase NamZ family protein n=1 Tax=Brachybacterium sp. YJGR34 TaxID=2059911 RepID=UPI001E32DD59|nr:DUF1343 domain-containing protein [Brachybacterium sp. YJGR34]